MFQPAESLGMDNAVTVTLETGSYGAWLFPFQPTTTGLTLSGIRRKGFFLLLCLLAYTEFANHGITITIVSRGKIFDL
jgi:hypothetical protein